MWLSRSLVGWRPLPICLPSQHLLCLDSHATPWLASFVIFSALLTYNDDESSCCDNMFIVQVVEPPVRTSPKPREIPQWLMRVRTVSGLLMGGILPFGCIFIQAFFILNSIWSARCSVVYLVLIYNMLYSVPAPYGARELYRPICFWATWHKGP